MYIIYSPSLTLLAQNLCTFIYLEFYAIAPPENFVRITIWPVYHSCHQTKQFFFYFAFFSSVLCIFLGFFWTSEEVVEGELWADRACDNTESGESDPQTQTVPCGTTSWRARQGHRRNREPIQPSQGEMGWTDAILSLFATLNMYSSVMRQTYHWY